jgi:hypothetical protein
MTCVELNPVSVSSPLRRRGLSLFLLVLMTVFLQCVLTRPLMADDIAVKEIGGVPVIRCKIHYGDKYIEAHILFDVGLNTPMVIHEKSVGGLELTPRQAVGKKVDIEFAGNRRWRGIPMQVADVKFLATLTAKYAPELKEVPVVAVVGLAAIKSSVVNLDIRKGLLQTLGMGSEKARQEEFDYQVQRYGIVLKGIGPTKTPVNVLMVTRSEDSVLDTSLLKAARKAGSKPNVLSVNEIMVSDHAAMRFSPLNKIGDGSVKAVIGLSVMRNYAVTIWPKRKKIAFLPHTAPSFPQGEQDYFFALVDKKPEGVVKFISTKPRRRLMDEACLVLLQMRLSDLSGATKTFKESLQIFAANYDIKRRSDALAKIADKLETTNRPDSEELSMFALNLAMTQTKASLDPTSVHGIHVRYGKKAFFRGEIKKARRHLLSAAFGMPKNGECNFWMGEVYREMGKPRRAWSRYFQSILDPRVPSAILKESLARLDELNSDPKFRKTFNMVIAEQYMAGRLEAYEFHAKSRYRLAKTKSFGHVKLVEFFTDADNPATGGMQLAFQALDEYFNGDVALIEYHLNDSMHSDTAANRLKYYKAKNAPLAVFDGKPVLSRNASQEKELSKNAAGNYPAFRDACLLKEAGAKPVWTLAASMTQEATKVSGTVTVSGKGKSDKLRLHAIVCERSVMAVKGNGVFFHHFVVHKTLTGPDGLDLKIALEKPVKFAVDAEKIRQGLATMLNSGKDWGDVSKAGYVDANKLMIVTFVQHQDDRRILAAKSFSLPQEDEL